MLSFEIDQIFKPFKYCVKITSIKFANEHIFQMLAQYSLVLPQYSASIVTIFASIEQVNTPYVISQNRYHVWPSEIGKNCCQSYRNISIQECKWHKQIEFRSRILC